MPEANAGLWGRGLRSRGRNSVRSNCPDTAMKSQGNLFFSGGQNGGQVIV